MGRRHNPNAMLGLAGCVSMFVAALCLALALNDRSLTFALGGVMALTALFAILIEPFAGLLVYVAFLYLRPGDRYPVLEAYRLTFLVGGLTLFVWFAQDAIRRRIRFEWHPLHGVVLALLAAAGISMIPVSMRGALGAVTAFGKMILLYFMVASLARRPGQIRALAWVVVLCSAFNAVSGWHQTQLAPEANRFGGRVAGVGELGDPNDLALSLIVSLPLAIALWTRERGFWRRWLLFAMIGILIGGVIVTESRGGALALMLVLVFEGYERIPSRTVRFGYLAVTLFLGFSAIGLLLAQRGTPLGTVGEDESVSDRKAAWKGGLRMLLDRPFTGVGIYRFSDALDTYAPPDLTKRNLEAHNSFVQAAGDMGLLGLFSFTAMIVLSWLACRRIRRRLDQQPNAPPIFAAVARSLGRSLAGWTVCAMFLTQTYQAWIYLLVGLIAATALQLEHGVEPPDETPREQLFR